MEVGDDSLFDHVSSVSAWPLIGPPMMNPCRFTRKPDNDVDGRADAASLLCNQCVNLNGAADHPPLEASP